MWTTLAILALSIAPAHADDSAVVVDSGKVVAVDAARAPRSAELIGTSCSFRTGMIARRVVAEGEDYAYMGTLKAVPGEAEGDVACPYRIGTADGACVVANELVEHLQAQGVAARELSLEGRTLELDGVRYVVLTAYTVSRS